jgi:hypothetical protein
MTDEGESHMWSVVEDNFGYWLAVTMITFIAVSIGAMCFDADVNPVRFSVMGGSSIAMGTACTIVRMVRKRRRGRKAHP